MTQQGYGRSNPALNLPLPHNANWTRRFEIRTRDCEQRKRRARLHPLDTDPLGRRGPPGPSTPVPNRIPVQESLDFGRPPSPHRW